MDEASILICYDGTDGARRAVDVAADLFPGCHAVVLDVAPFLTGAESVAELSALTPNFEQLNEDEGLKVAREGATLAREAGLTADPRSDVAAPTWGGIVEVADEINAAVIVVGSRGLMGVREVFQGSVSHDVAEHAGRPVLVVPPHRSSNHA
jgi:nucleotide-binding universal stress UspA family protein